MQSLIWVLRAITPFSCKLFGHEWKTYALSPRMVERKECCMQCGIKRTVGNT